MKHRNAKECVMGFILRIENATTERSRVGFTVVNSMTGESGKQSDVAKFGFFVAPEDALRVLGLVGAQVLADNATLANENAVSAAD